MHIFKVARALLIFFSCGYLTYIATTGFQDVLTGEIGVAVSAVTDLNKKEFPLYTFCPDWLAPIHPEGLYEGKVDVESIIFDENDVQDFVTVNSLIGINGTWLKTYKLKTSVEDNVIVGSLNPCFTHYLPEVERYEDLAKEISYEINMTSFGDLHLSVHDDGGYIDTHFNVYGRDQITFPTQMLGKAINRIVKIEIRNQEIEVADKSQCKDITELDPYCLEKVVEEKIGCKVPWSHTDSEIQNCSGSASLKQMVDLWPDSMSSRSELIQTLDNMKCYKSCIYNNYQPVKIYDKEYEDTVNTQNEAFLSLHIRLNNQGLERHAEHYIFNWGSFFAEIGGYLGLFLGYALISMVDFVENVWTSICKPPPKKIVGGTPIGTPMRIRSRLSSRRSSAESGAHSGNYYIENSSVHDAF